ncbi:Pr6Pr family membrane protein [Demequina pelophila]|uniref:Pr6Pr family membrane protein n=1 Tax=Demequina pelophila TaxID=1638984 RepID=UPI000782F075|nr:Pr6Pr family membrane protein [Demequina pelophila]
MVRFVSGARIGAALLMLAAVARLMWDQVEADTLVLWNFFGFFTIQTNLIGAFALIVVATRTGRARPAWLEYLRASAAVYLVIVVAVFWTLLAPTSDDLTRWTNLVVHGLSGVVLVVDWLIEGPRERLPLTRLWVVIAYPLGWAAVVLVRGATDGWVPYPFLEPAHGYASIAMVVGGICVAGLVLGAALYLTPRTRPVTVDDARVAVESR